MLTNISHECNNTDGAVGCDICLVKSKLCFLVTGNDVDDVNDDNLYEVMLSVKMLLKLSFIVAGWYWEMEPFIVSLSVHQYFL